MGGPVIKSARHHSRRTCWACTKVRKVMHRYPEVTPAQSLDENECYGCGGRICESNGYNCTDDDECIHSDEVTCDWCAEWKPILASMRATKEAGR